MIIRTIARGRDASIRPRDILLSDSLSENNDRLVYRIRASQGEPARNFRKSLAHALLSNDETFPFPYASDRNDLRTSAYVSAA